LPVHGCFVKHNRNFQDQYQRPDSDDEDLDRIHARFNRLARKVRDESGTGRTKFIRPASRRDAPVFAQSEQGQLPMMAA
jgi:hypothetical protein